MSTIDPHFEYLGDGVYASFDGYHVWLHLGSHLAPPLVALDPEVFRALVNYRQRVVGQLQGLEQLKTRLAAQKKAPGPPNVSPEPDVSPLIVRAASEASSEGKGKRENDESL